MAERWSLRIGPPFDLSYGYVAEALRADGTEAVLKIGGPDREAPREILALGLYDGDGVCRLLEADEDRCAMLLERLRPGETLVALAQRDDEAATRVGAAVARALWRPAPPNAGLQPIASWFHDAFGRHRAYYGGAGPFPPQLFERAERLAGDLLDSADSQVLLHGDFHHYNVLSAERSPWLAIDPKDMVGDPGYELAVFLGNPHEADLGITRRLLDRRLAVFAEELGYDRDRLRDWGIAHAVLSACWSAEDGGGTWRQTIRVAETLVGL
ncbi:MAG: phosphotransferase [Chloroflexi bacterium]|nr:phosphotransferase [Chloroflexota bacterium]